VNDPNPPGRPEYKVYRSRKRPLGRLAGGTDLDALRRRLGRARSRDPEDPRERRRITPGRVLKWIALAVLGWLLLSLVLFMVSAQVQKGVSDSAKKSLSNSGNLLTGSTILVLGSDARTGSSIDRSQAGPSRADTIMLVHAGLGSVRKLSIPRDTQVQIPGHPGANKINAAYALGGPALMIETVQSFLGNGVKINHLVEVDFKNFPALIDSLGGITVNNKSRICSPPFDNFWKGLRFRKGQIQLDGIHALGYARVRKNRCAPAEDDRARAARQQEVLRAMGDKVSSPGTFFRLPWVSWKAPKAFKTDMRGPGLMALFADLATGNSSDTAVLKAGCCINGSNLFVSDGSKRDAVKKLENGG
jgi:LCP family protein required for cell wall assembly